ncbi:MAG: preprotein translocase subunit SecG [Candidatus Hydrothermota bacterium]|nr:MAG: preprotein translocase subunit SecG [Candidatus Hydrothermae bacterium]
MFTVLLILYVLVVILLIAVILVQQPRRGGLGAIGGMGLENVLGVRGAPTLFTKLTAVLGGLFLFLSLVLSAMHAPSKPSGALEKAQREGILRLPPVQQQQQQPAQGGR